MNDLHTELGKMYKGNLVFILRQQNLTPNVYDKVFKPNFSKVIDNYNTGINSTNLNKAFEKVDEVKAIAQRSVEQMNKNREDTEKLLASTEEINMLAKDFQKNAHEMEVIQKRNSFWLCSKPCVLMGIGCVGLCLLLWLIIKWIM